MGIVFATCQAQLDLTHPDALLSAELQRRGVSVTVAPWDVIAPFGGSWEPTIVGASLREFGEGVLATVSRPWLYARVDVVEANQGPVLARSQWMI